MSAAAIPLMAELGYFKPRRCLIRSRQCAIIAEASRAGARISSWHHPGSEHVIVSPYFCEARPACPSPAARREIVWRPSSRHFCRHVLAPIARNCGRRVARQSSSYILKRALPSLFIARMATWPRRSRFGVWAPVSLISIIAERIVSSVANRGRRKRRRRNNGARRRVN